MRFVRIDFIHETWLTASRVRIEVPEQDVMSWRYKTVAQQNKFHERRGKIESHNVKFVRPCVYCGQVGADDIQHYCSKCLEILQQARWKGLLGEDDLLSPALLLGLECIDPFDGPLFWSWNLLLFAMWRQLDWSNRSGIFLFELSAEVKRRRWQEAEDASKLPLREKHRRAPLRQKKISGEKKP